MEDKDPWTDDTAKAETIFAAENPTTKYLDGPMNYLIFIFTIMAGLSIWVFSSDLVGNHEPWDSNKPYFYMALFISGVIFGLAKPVRYSRWVMAIFIGQLIGLVFVGMGDFILLGVMILAICSLIALLGAAAGASLVTTINKCSLN